MKKEDLNHVLLLVLLLIGIIFYIFGKWEIASGFITAGFVIALFETFRGSNDA
ncbi:MAG: hypothetical protein ABIB79_03480 [archaeon]